MQKLQVRGDFLSLFQGAGHAEGVHEPLPVWRGLAIALVGAFFITMAAAFILSGPFAGAFSAYSQEKVTEDKVAYQPGMFITEEISRGYIGR